MNHFKLSLILLFLAAVLVFSACFSKKETISIVTGTNPPEPTKIAAEILKDYLEKIYTKNEFSIRETSSNSNSVFLMTRGDIFFKTLEAELEGVILPEEPESFVIKSIGSGDQKSTYIISSDQRSLFYAVYELLEQLGCRFYLSEEFIVKKESLFKAEKLNISNTPLFGKRFVFNWHNFLSGCSAWDFPEYRKWIDAAQKMKYNAIMLHAYGNNPMFRFEFNGEKKPSGYIPNSQRGRDWGTNHVNDIRNLYGGEIFTEAIFGAEVSKAPEPEVEEQAVKLMQEVFSYAEQRSMEVIFAFDIATNSSNPPNILNTLPEEARLYNHNGNILPNPETPNGYKYFKSHISGILKDYPGVNYLVPWVRYMFYPKGKGYLNIREFPPAWEKEFQNIINKYDNFDDEYGTRSFFYLGKIIKAYQKILIDIDRTDITLGLGTWNWWSFPYLDKFIPENVEFFPIDWDVNFSSDYSLQKLTSLEPDRIVYPVVWAHHDDHSYIGRPYTPPGIIVDKLKERQAEGFGILHWNTYPLDMYFKNLTAQVWKLTRNENYESTIKDYAVNAIASENAAFNNYLQSFFLTAPHFARETSDYFYDFNLTDFGKSIFPVYNPESIIDSAKVRLSALTDLKERNFPVSNTDVFHYFMAMEEFFISFFENQNLLIEAAGLCMEGKPEKARSIIEKTTPEKAILKYAEAIQFGPQTVGEEAIILSLNLKWLPDFIDIRQKTGLLPIEYKFHPTSHEPLASGAGKYTYFADENKKITLCLGEKETNGALISAENNGEIHVSSETVEFKVGHWRNVPESYFSETWKDNRLFPGKYNLILKLNTTNSNYTDQELHVQLKNDSEKILNVQKLYNVNNSSVLVPFTIGKSLLHISLNTKGEKVKITGLFIEKLD